MEGSTPAAAVNAPHPADPDPDDFFGDTSDDGEMDAAAQAEEAAALDAAAAEQPAAEAAPAPTPEPEPAAAPPAPTPEPEPEALAPTMTAADRKKAADAAAKAQAQVAAEQEETDAPAEPATPPAAPPPDPATQQAAPPPPAPEPPAETPAAERPKERPYIVFRELVLDAAALDKLAKHVAEGADPPIVYVQVETVQARNDTHAIKQVYAGHRATIGDKPRLVPVSGRAWKVRNVQPRQRIEEALDIS